MASPKIIDITADELIQKHGAGAPRIVDVMIGHAIANGRNDEALELDRMLRAVKLKVRPGGN